MTEPRLEYHDDKSCTIIVFDVRLPNAGRRFSHERAAWGEYADVEMLDLNHPVLVVRPGATLELLSDE